MEDAFGPLTPNQLVALNLSLIRQLRGWTQDKAAENLEPLLGGRWSKASFSLAERSAKGGRPREFTADEILALSFGFRVPLTWFFLPPPEVERVTLGDTEVSAAALTEWIRSMSEGVRREVAWQQPLLAALDDSDYRALRAGLGELPESRKQPAAEAVASNLQRLLLEVLRDAASNALQRLTREGASEEQGSEQESRRQHGTGRRGRARKAKEA